MTETPPLKKSERTRARIAAAARALFADAGFAATSVRDIAERAECDPALIIRYFGSKEALFTEVGQFDLNLPDLRGLTPAQAARRVAEHFVRVWEQPESGTRFQTLLRSAAAHEQSADRLRKVFTLQVRPAFAAYCGDAPAAERLAARVASVVLGTALTRYVLRLPYMADLTPEELCDLLASGLATILSDRAAMTNEARR